MTRPGVVTVIGIAFAGVTACTAAPKESAGAGAPKDAAPTPAVVESPVAAVEKWRAKHETDYRREWVSIAGLHQLKPGANSAGSHPGNDIVLPASAPASLGKFVLTGDRVRFEPAPGAAVLRKDQPVTAPLDLRHDGESDADELVMGDVRVVVHASGERRALRVRDPSGPLAKGFLGFSWFPIDEQYRVTGRYIPDAEPHKVKVVNTFGDIDDYTTEGVVEFTLMGKTLRLRPFTTRPKRFYFVFRDASSGQRDVRRRAVPLFGSRRRWHDGARVQRGVQPAVRVQSVHDVSAAAA